MPNKGKTNEEQHPVNTGSTYYGVDPTLLNARFIDKLEKMTYLHYANHLDKLSWIDWTQTDLEVKKSLENTFCNLRSKYMLDYFKFDPNGTTDALYQLISEKDYKDALQEVTNNTGKYYTGKKQDAFASYFHYFYAAAKKDQTTVDDVKQFLHDPLTQPLNSMVQTQKIRHEVAKNDKAKKSELDCRNKNFRAYQGILQNCINDMRKTDSAWFSSDAYDMLKRRMDRLYPRLKPNEKLNETDLAAAEKNFRKSFNDLMDYCNFYVYKHRPKNGNYKNMKLSETQMKRLSVINEIKQLYQLYSKSNDPMEQSGELDDRSPLSCSFLKKRTALKYLSQSTMNTISNRNREGTDPDTVETSRKFLFDAKIRNAQINELTKDSDSFDRMCERGRNPAQKEQDFYCSMSMKSGKELVSIIGPGSASDALIHSHQMDFPLLP